MQGREGKGRKEGWVLFGWIRRVPRWSYFLDLVSILIDLVVSFGDLVGCAFGLPVVVGRVTFGGVTAGIASGEHTGTRGQDYHMVNESLVLWVVLEVS